MVLGVFMVTSRIFFLSSSAQVSKSNLASDFSFIVIHPESLSALFLVGLLGLYHKLHKLCKVSTSLERLLSRGSDILCLLLGSVSNSMLSIFFQSLKIPSTK